MWPTSDGTATSGRRSVPEVKNTIYVWQVLCHVSFLYKRLHFLID